MSDFLDMVRERQEEARARHAVAQLSFQAANAELQAATSELAIWTNAVTLETRAREKRAADAAAAHFPMNLPGMPDKQQEQVLSPADRQSEEVPDVASAGSQTERVREVIRAHGTGVKPIDIWTEVQDAVSSRAYLYSILKRMRDNEEVSVRRGKYIFRPKPVEVQTLAIQ